MMGRRGRAATLAVLLWMEVTSNAFAPNTALSKTRFNLGAATSTDGVTHQEFEQEQTHQPQETKKRAAPRKKKMPMAMPQKENVEAASAAAEITSPEELSPDSLKGKIFQRVYERYPELLENEECTGIGDEDIRQQRHPIFTGLPAGTDLDVVFIGTASCTPGTTRGVSCTALRLNRQRQQLFGTPQKPHKEEDSLGVAGTWLFDCGESTQLQVQRTSSVKPGKINKIFLTHAHGDHSFGLPGILCLMGTDRDRENSQPVDIYGPEGLRMWLRATIRYSVSRIVPNYRVHEIKDVPMAPEWSLNRKLQKYFFAGMKTKQGERKEWGYQGFAGEDPESWISRANMLDLKPSARFGEVEGGRDIYPIYDHPKCVDGAPIWEIEEEEDVKVFAAPMSHGIPCVGYVVEENSRPGRLRDEIVKPMVQRNLKALKEAGFRIPMKAMSVIKHLPVGSEFRFPDGSVITQEEAVEPERKGRKIVICGDTASSRAIEGLAQGADVLIHEATNTFLAGIDKMTDLKNVTRDTVVHGHSTPHLAGKLAARIGAKRLLLNHFSARYKGDQTVESLSIMLRLEGQAIQASGLDETKVATAWDFMVLPVPME